MSGPPYSRRHDTFVLNEGRVDWEAGCLTCGWRRVGLTLTAAEDLADEHALNPPEKPFRGGAA